jgi:serine/threonine protein phosphatase PrpC
MWRTTVATDSYRTASGDRAAVVVGPGGTFAVVADGVGGRAGGGAAADAVMQAMRELAEQNPMKWDRIRWMAELDRQMGECGTVGETTAVVAQLTAVGPLGVAVGDSVAWWVRDDDWGSLTDAAVWKPWVGTGGAVPVPFGKPLQYVGTLLLATDGLVKYTSAERIVGVVRTTPFDDLPQTLIELVRPPSGRLPDDVAVIVARWEPAA